MKYLLSCCLLISAFLLRLSAEPPRVTRVQTDWSVTGDFDGDGTLDVAILETARGVYRILYGGPNGGEFSPVRSLGTTDVSGISAGRFGNLTHDRLLLASQTLNRVQGFDDASRTSGSAPFSIQITGIGPTEVVSLPLIRDSLSGEADLVVFSEWNNTGPQIERLDGLSTQALHLPLFSETLREGQALPFEQGGDILPVFVRNTAGGDEEVWIGSPDKPLMSTLLAHPLTGSGNQLTWGIFPAAIHPTLFLWRGGSKTLEIVDLEPDPNLSGGLRTKRTFSHTFVGKIPTSVVVLNSDPAQLLILFEGTEDAELHEYDLNGGLVLLESFPPPSGGVHRLGAPRGDGTFALMSSESAEGPLSQTEVFRHDQAPYSSVTTHALSTDTAEGGANVFVYSEEIFVSENSIRTYAAQAPDWSVAAEISGNQLRATRRVDGGSGPGLSNESTLDLTPWNQGGFPVANQFLPDVSLVALDPVLGEQIARAEISPDSGAYSEAIQIHFSVAPETATVFYRVPPDGLWTAAPPDPFWISQDREYQFYAQLPSGQKSPIQQATYTFPSPDTLDTDQDGTPDYVELARGLDPTAGFDTDEDGWSDLDEWCLGTNPNDATDFPAQGSPKLRLQPQVDVLLTPVAPGLQRNPVTGDVQQVVLEEVLVPEMQVRLSALDGGLIRTESTDPDLEPPAAMFTDIPTGFRFPWLIFSTPETFPVRGDLLKEVGIDERSGRLLLRILLSPDLPALGSPVYSYQGLNPAVEAQNWLNAAFAFYTDEVPLQLDMTVDPEDTLVALLFERGVGQELLNREITNTASISLFPFLRGEGDRPSPSLQDIISLRSTGAGGQAARSPEDFLVALENAIDASVGKTQDLVDLTHELYRIATLLGNSDPEAYPSPAQALRQFISGSTLPPAYLPELSLTPQQLVSAADAVPVLVNLLPERPFVIAMRLWPSASVTSGERACSVFVDSMDTEWALLAPDGDPFPLPLTLNPTEEMEFRVTGYTDLSSTCAVNTIEVTSIVLSSVILAGTGDENGNLLPDELERLFFGGEGGVFDVDSDDDTFSDLQEILEGKDPRDPMSTPSVGAVQFEIPELVLDQEGGIHVTWNWPSRYQNALNFVLETSVSLDNEFSSLPYLPSSEGDVMTITGPALENGTILFYRLGVSLK